MEKFLDKTGLARVWENTKSYVDNKFGTSGGSGGSGGTINWEDINGRPDLSSVSSMKSYPVVLRQELWDEQNEQTVSIPEILEDQMKQLVVPEPIYTDKIPYIQANIDLIGRSDGAVTFRADNIPHDDIHMIVYVFSAAEVGEIIIGGTFEWWSPKMTSDTMPQPYVASASIYSSNNRAYKAFNGDEEDYWYSGAPGGGPVYIQFDFGGNPYISGIKMKAAINSDFDYLPKTFTIQGSNDNDIWTTIYEADGTEYPSVSQGETHIYDFETSNYRYYRILCSQCYFDGSAKSLINEIEFLKLEDAQ